MKYKSVHIGKEIEGEMLRQRMTQTELARRIGFAQQNIKRLFESASITTDKLIKVSIALGVDFFQLYRQTDADITIQQNADNATGYQVNGDGAHITPSPAPPPHKRIEELEAIIKDKNRQIASLVYIMRSQGITPPPGFEEFVAN